MLTSFTVVVIDISNNYVWQKSYKKGCYSKIAATELPKNENKCYEWIRCSNWMWRVKTVEQRIYYCDDCRHDDSDMMIIVACTQMVIIFTNIIILLF